MNYRFISEIMDGQEGILTICDKANYKPGSLRTELFQNAMFIAMVDDAVTAKESEFISDACDITLDGGEMVKLIQARFSDFNAFEEYVYHYTPTALISAVKADIRNKDSIIAGKVFPLSEQIYGLFRDVLEGVAWIDGANEDEINTCDKILNCLRTYIIQNRGF